MISPDEMRTDIEAATVKLQAYCRSNDWSGYEPYDALNSPLLKALPFLDSRLPRLALTQTLKRSPIDIRRLLRIPKTQNPKALAIFLSAFVRLSEVGFDGSEASSGQMIERLIALRSTGTKYWCWGYSFPWQTRTVLVPRWSPNLVCTSFAAAALVEAYEQRGESRCLNMAVSAAEYLVNELYWSKSDGTAGFGYPLPSVRNQVHNANFLGADVLCRVYRHTGEKKFLEPALKAARYSAAQQRADGSWDYGESPSQRWIDNFHTGFNLSALKSIDCYVETAEFAPRIERGLEFYRNYFFRKDGAVRYYHNQTYPIDTHCVAQSVITLLDLKDVNRDNLTLAGSVWRWAMDHMWDDRGFFYYRILRSCTIRTSYMRWTQAWMFLALSRLLVESYGASEPQAAASRDASIQA